MEVHIEHIDDVTLLKFSGKIDAFSAPPITERIHAQISSGRVKLVADFSAVDYTCSAGLRMLLRLVKETRERNGDIRLAAAQPDVQSVLDLSGFSNILMIYDTVDAALASFAS